MFSFITDKIAVVLEGLLVAALCVTCLSVGWKLYRADDAVKVLTLQNHELTTDNGTLRANQATLQSAIDKQNSAVQDMQTQRDAAVAAAASAAQANIAPAQVTRTIVLKQLQAAKAGSCEQAMPFVRKALGAMK